jgi:ribosomal protein L13
MPAFIDRVNKVYGRLTVIELLSRDKGAVLYKANCECGNQITVYSQQLSSGLQSCGCLLKDKLSSLKSVDRTGHRQGRLVITQKTNARKHCKIVWEAICDCGNKTTTIDSKKLSCGCLRSEMMRELGKSRTLPEDIRLQNLKESRKKTKEKRKSNPLSVMQKRLSRLHRHALAKVNAIKSSKTFEQLGYTVFEFKSHIEKQFEKGMSWDNMHEWQIDHIIPMSTAKTEDDVIKLNQLSNLRPMFSKENNFKKDKIIYLL